LVDVVFGAFLSCLSKNYAENTKFLKKSQFVDEIFALFDIAQEQEITIIQGFVTKTTIQDQ